MFCPQCGCQLPDNAQFCVSCGTRMPAMSGAPTGALVGQPAASGAPGAPAGYMGNGIPTAPITASARSGDTASFAPVAVEAPYYANPTPGGAVPADAVPVGAVPAGAVPTYPIGPNGSVAQADPPNAVVVEQPKKKRWVPWVVGIAAVAVVALVAVTLTRGVVGAPTSNPEAVVKNTAEAVLNLDFATAVDSYPDELVDYLASRAGLEGEDQLVAMIDDGVGVADEQLKLMGLDVRSLLSHAEYRVTGSSLYTQDGLASLKEHWNGIMPGFGDSFQEAASVDLDISGSINVLGQDISLSDYLGWAGQTITTVRIGNQWYVLDTSLFDSSLLNYI